MPIAPVNQHVPRGSCGGIAVGTDFEWIPRGALLSCMPPTGTCGCYCCVDGWTDAFVHVGTDAGLTHSFNILCVQGLTEGCSTWLGAKVVGVGFGSPAHRCRARGPCPQGHDSHN